MPNTGEMTSPIARRPRRTATLRIGRKYWRAIWPVPLLLLYVFGGAIQYLGWLTPTQCNMVVLAMFCGLLLRRKYWHTVRYEWPLLLLGVYFVVSGFARGTPTIATVVYLYYLVCALLAAPAGRLLAEELVEHHRTRATFHAVLAVLALELPIVALQHRYAATFAAHSVIRVGTVDAVFGTFPLNSDSVLAAGCALAVIGYSFISQRLRHIVTAACLASAIIFLGHSDAMQGIFALLLIPVFISHLYRRTTLRRYRRVIMLLGLLVALAALVIVSRSAYNGFLAFRSLAASEYATRSNWISAGRFAPWGQFFDENALHLLFGHGALSYYNPLSKEWLYNSGFSTVYSLSIDFGLVALLAYAAYQVRVILAVSPYRLFAYFLIAVWVAFMAFNDVLPNVAFIFELNFTLSFVSCYARVRAGVPAPADRLGVQ